MTSKSRPHAHVLRNEELCDRPNLYEIKDLQRRGVVTRWEAPRRKKRVIEAEQVECQIGPRCQQRSQVGVIPDGGGHVIEQHAMCGQALPRRRLDDLVAVMAPWLNVHTQRQAGVARRSSRCTQRTFLSGCHRVACTDFTDDPRSNPGRSHTTDDLLGELTSQALDVASVEVRRMRALEVPASPHDHMCACRLGDLHQAVRVATQRRWRRIDERTHPTRDGLADLCNLNVEVREAVIVGRDGRIPSSQTRDGATIEGLPLGLSVRSEHRRHVGPEMLVNKRRAECRRRDRPENGLHHSAVIWVVSAAFVRSDDHERGSILVTSGLPQRIAFDAVDHDEDTSVVSGTVTGIDSKREIMTESLVQFSEAIGRRVRGGVWEDQKVSTYRKIQEALASDDRTEAARLASYFIDEANVCFTLYRQWIADLNGFLTSKGVDDTDLAATNVRIVELLALPDGEPWVPRRQWDRFLTAVETFTGHAHRGDTAEALAALDHMKEMWRRCHDRDVDHTYALMHEIVERFGESALREMWDVVLIPLFNWRYAKFDIDEHPWDEALETLMLVACEAMRGHLVGPERTGDFELIETDDRFILRFDPCGSGGRTIRGDWIEGTPARMEPPYNWSVSEEPNTWNHGESGICHYCTHCIVLMEEMPIDRFGYPVRVIDPPRYPDTDKDPEVRQKCQWQMFKDPTNVPAEYYVRVGREKPTTFGGRTHGGPIPGGSSAGLPGEG